MCQQLNSYVDLSGGWKIYPSIIGILSDGPPENPCIGRKKRTYGTRVEACVNVLSMQLDAAMSLPSYDNSLTIFFNIDTLFIS
jgi:hypothetical protein